MQDQLSPLLTPESLLSLRLLIGNSPPEELLLSVMEQMGISPTGTASDGLTRWCPVELHPAQRFFLSLNCREALYGGAAGGGKSVALLAAALQYAHVPGYRALILRRDFRRLALPGALLDMAEDWLIPRGAKYDRQEHCFELPCEGGGCSTLTIGYFDNWGDRMRYSGPAFQCVIFDELTEMPEQFYTFMFTRMRRTSDVDVPIRMRGATNPGGPGHVWVKKRFITEEAMDAISEGRASARVFYTDAGRAFVPAFIADNPSLVREEYEANLREVADPVMRARLLNGDWRVTEEGLVKSTWFRHFKMRGQLIDLWTQSSDAPIFTVDERDCQRFATCDTAGTAKEIADQQKQKKFSWSTCGIWDVVNVGNKAVLCLRHVWREQVDFTGLVDGVSGTLDQWGRPRVLIEDAATGRPLGTVLRNQGYNVEMISPGGKDKVVRAAPLLNLWKEGRVYHDGDALSLWREDFEDECIAWTGQPDETNDQIDMAAYAGQLVDAGHVGGVSVVYMPSRDRGFAR